MPYIVTTGTPWGQNLGARDKYAVTSRRAVATLDEAHAEVYSIGQTRDVAQHPQGRAQPWLSYYAVDRAIPEQGGSVTLPDGTVIEVEPIGWRALDDAATYGASIFSHVPARAPTNHEKSQIIDAYNAAQQ